MTNVNHYLILVLLFSMGGMVSENALAFGCNTSGNRQVVAPNLKKDTNSNVVIIDMASYVTCSGNSLDNLRVYSSSIDSRLATYGFIGVLNIGGVRFDMPATGKYIWPYANSTAVINSGSATVKATIELRRSTKGNWGAGVTLPAGTVIATITAQQRSGSNWGWPVTWNYTLNAPLVIPAYTCNVSNPANRTITLPKADYPDLRVAGTGRYEKSKTRFSFTLACDVLATVDVSFSGSKMTGKEDVLKNLESGNQNIGVQIFPADSSTAIRFDNVATMMLDSASADETVNYDAYYYYDGGNLTSGPFKASMVYTFSYR